MSAFSYVVVLAAVVAFVQSGNDFRVLDGKRAGPYEFPFMVSIFLNGFHFCGGTILTPLWILTAAHCVSMEGKTEELTIFYNSTTLTNTGRTGVIAYPRRVIIHGDYSSAVSGSPNDIAVIELCYEIIQGPGAQPVNLVPRGVTPLAANKPGIMVGWGSIRERGRTVIQLQRGPVSIYNNDECARFYGSTNSTIQYCAGSLDGKTGPCYGDSGGPLMFEGNQIGLVSWIHKPCNQARKPGVMTRLDSYREWIFEKTGV